MPRRKATYPRVFLREWRELKGLKQPALARLIGSNKFFVSRIETGKQGASKEDRDLLGSALEISGDMLLAPPPVNRSLEDAANDGRRRVQSGEASAVPEELLTELEPIIEQYGYKAVRAAAALIETRRRKVPHPQPRRA